VHSADELLVTELLFNGVFNDLTPEQCCALLSCFVFQEKSHRHPRLTEQLSGPLRLLQVLYYYLTTGDYLLTLLFVCLAPARYPFNGFFVL